MNNEIEKEIFLENLPIWKKGEGKVRAGTIKWGECNGYKVKGIYDNIKFEIEIIGYNKDTRKLTIQYKNKEYKLFTGEFQKCSLGKILGLVTDEFKIEIGQSFKDDKRDIIITDREYRYKKKKSGYIEKCKWYKYHCNKDGYEDWIVESSLLNQKHGCLLCSNQVVVEGINDIPTTAPWMIPYFQGGYDEAKKYTQTSEKQIFLMCPHCLRAKDKKLTIRNLYKNKSIGCACRDGQPYTEKLMFNVLEQLGIDFEYHKMFNWSKNILVDDNKLCGNKEYDFHIPSLNILLETHGNQHYEYGGRGRSFTLEESNDKLKKKLAIKNGIKKENYIIIDCRKSDLDFIKQNILKSRLSEIFDLSNIDWLKAEEFALSNRVKEACEYKKNNPDLSNNDIGNLMNLQGQTIRKYLIKGSKIWDWCNYSPQEEMKKVRIKNGKASGLPLVVLKSDIFVGIFKSCTDLSRKIQNITGFSKSVSTISFVCIGKQENCIGYTFKYIKDLTKEEYLKYDIENKLKELHNQ